jgi:hypothetical protein
MRKTHTQSVKSHLSPEDGDSMFFSETLLSACKSTRRHNPEQQQRQTSQTLYILYALLVVARMIISRRVRLVEHVARMGETENT